jgi:chromosomal replication initiator protein
MNFDAGHGPGSGLVPASSDFVAGPENSVALAAVDAVLDDGPPRWSPWVFFGPSGVGKSHLAVGLVAVWKARHRGSAIYATALDFARELADAIETQATDDFQARYRHVSLLVLDDVHRLASREAVQEELICVLDALADIGGRVVLTAATAPEQLAGFLPRLQSRMVSGLAVPLAIPGPAARRVLLRRLAQGRSMAFDEPILEILANKMAGPVPQLAGILAQLEITARGQSGTITPQMVQQCLAARTVSSPSFREIAALTARHFSMKVTDLRSKSRRRTVVIARDVAMYLARTLTGSSLKQIGTYFAGRDHTTVAHGCCKTEQLVKSDPAIRAAVEHLRDRLQTAQR